MQSVNFKRTSCPNWVVHTHCPVRVFVQPVRSCVDQIQPLVRLCALLCTLVCVSPRVRLSVRAVAHTTVGYARGATQSVLSAER